MSFGVGEFLPLEKEDIMPEKHGIGWAVERLHDGLRVCRIGWNGRGMFLFLVLKWTLLPSENGAMIDASRALPFVAMKTADDMIVPWLASQTDILATDWQIAE